MKKGEKSFHQKLSHFSFSEANKEAVALIPRKQEEYAKEAVEAAANKDEWVRGWAWAEP